jgi:predicted enzyme related to lactoylglutathione lyase
MWTHEHFYWNALMTKDGEKPIGGIFDIAHGDHDGMPDGWFAYIAVDDVAARLAKVEAADGKVLRPPFEVPGVGLSAIVRDKIGALVGWSTPSAPD